MSIPQFIDCMSIPYCPLYLPITEFSCTAESEQTEKWRAPWLFGFDPQIVNSQRTQNPYLYTEALLTELQLSLCVQIKKSCLPQVYASCGPGSYQAELWCFSHSSSAWWCLKRQASSHRLWALWRGLGSLCEVTVGLWKSCWVCLLALLSTSYLTLGRPPGPLRPLLMCER